MSKGESSRGEWKRGRARLHESLEATQRIAYCVLVQREANEGQHTGSSVIQFILINSSLATRGQ